MESQTEDHICNTGVFATNIFQEENITEHSQGKSISSQLRQSNESTDQVTDSKKPPSNDKPASDI